MAKLILSFSELAAASGCSYITHIILAASIARSLQRSIKRCTNLATALVETGYQPYNHRWLSPKQYGLTIENLGDPFPE